MHLMSWTSFPLCSARLAPRKSWADDLHAFLFQGIVDEKTTGCHDSITGLISLQYLLGGNSYGFISGTTTPCIGNKCHITGHRNAAKNCRCFGVSSYCTFAFEQQETKPPGRKPQCNQAPDVCWWMQQNTSEKSDVLLLWKEFCTAYSEHQRAYRYTGWRRRETPLDTMQKKYQFNNYHNHTGGEPTQPKNSLSS